MKCVQRPGEAEPSKTVSAGDSCALGGASEAVRAPCGCSPLRQSAFSDPLRWPPDSPAGPRYGRFGAIFTRGGGGGGFEAPAPLDLLSGVTRGVIHEVVPAWGTLTRTPLHTHRPAAPQGVIFVTDDYTQLPQWFVRENAVGIAFMVPPRHPLLLSLVP